MQTGNGRDVLDLISGQIQLLQAYHAADSIQPADMVGAQIKHGHIRESCDRGDIRNVTVSVQIQTFQGRQRFQGSYVRNLIIFKI